MDAAAASRGLANYFPLGTRAVADIGCNEGALLAALASSDPSLMLAGVDINDQALSEARRRVPHADIRAGSASSLPFSDGQFDCVTCMDVLEHVPPEERPAAVRELARVLRSGGRAVVQVPHAGCFAVLDPQNMRFRFPRLYAVLVGRGVRDQAYSGVGQDVVWHEHFSDESMQSLFGTGWRLVHTHHGGLFLSPLTDLLRWPFYRTGRRSALVQFLQRVAAADMARDYGAWSYEILIVVQREG